MSEASWTWILFGMEVIGVSGMFLVGRRFWWGWLVVLAHSVPWFVYSIANNKPGFIAMSLMWWTMHAYNATRWFKEARRG